MSPKAFWIGLFACGLLASPAHAQVGQPSVTVLPFGGSVSAGAAEEGADRLAAGLVESGRYRVLDRAWLRLKSKAHATPDDLSEAGRDAGLDYVLMGSIYRRGPITTLRIRAIDVLTASIARETLAEGSPPPQAVFMTLAPSRGAFGVVRALAITRARLSKGDAGLDRAIGAMTKLLTNSPLR